MAQSSARQLRQQLVTQYDAFAARLLEIYKAGSGKGEPAIAAAAEQARTETSASLGSEQAEAFAGYVQRDLARIAAEVRRRPEEAKALFDPSRWGAGALAALCRMLEHGDEALLAAYEKADWAVPHDAGEITCGGTLVCLKCGYEQQFDDSTYLLMCPVCDGTSYRKTY